ncbi:MAG: hypothetical protein ABH811_02110, partial [archaeon]
SLGDKIPMFAHEVAISTVFRAEKTKKGKIKKESCTELVFFDGVGKKAIARIVLPFGTLKSLPRLIDENVKKIKKELQNKELPQKNKVETKTTNASYVG